MEAGRARYHGMGAITFSKVLVARTGSGVIVSCRVSAAHDAATQLRSLGCRWCSVSAVCMARSMHFSRDSRQPASTKN